MAAPTVSWTFTFTCPCGVTAHVINGREQPHTCNPISAQQVRDANADGYGDGYRDGYRDATEGRAATVT